MWGKVGALAKALRELARAVAKAAAVADEVAVQEVEHAVAEGAVRVMDGWAEDRVGRVGGAVAAAMVMKSL